MKRLAFLLLQASSVCLFAHAARSPLALSAAGTFTYGYYIGNNISTAPMVRTIGLPNLAWITNHFDNLDRLDYTALMNRWGHVLDGYSYTHDPLGLRTNILRDFGLTTNSVAIGYDNIGQLISWSGKESNNTLRQNEQLGWNYDAANNLSFRTNGLLLQTFNSDAVNELTNITRSGPLTVSGATPVPEYVTVNGLTADSYGDFTFARTNLSLTNGLNSFTDIALNFYAVGTTNTLTVNLPQSVNLQFDSNGNLTNDGTRSFVYDAENQLTNVYVLTAWKTEFVYDGLGRRRVAKDYSWQSGNWLKTNETHYIFDGMLPVQERDSNNVAQVTYTRGLDISGSIQGAGGIGGLLARTDANGSAYYHADGAGNITALMGGNGDLLARYLYNPFGKTLGQWGPLANANAMQFSSMPRHTNSGLSLYAFRGYDPNFQRWVSRDPSGEMDSINLYEPFFNAPTLFSDRDGRDNLYNVSPSGGTYNNNVPVMVINAPVSGGPVSVSYPGGGFGDPLFGLGAMTIGGMLLPAATHPDVVALAATIADMLRDEAAEAKRRHEIACSVGPLWTSTGSKTAVQNAFGHWQKHRAEFPEFQNAKQYVEGAKTFFTDPPPGTLTKTRPDGDTLFYDPLSNTFGVQAADSAPRTLFRPTSGISYWNKQ